jgi:mono/diheme cytochrome c family protein
LKIILSLVIAALLCAIGGIVFIYSGAYDVAATVPHNPIVAWVLDTTMVESVRAHARSIQAPALDQPQVVESGAGHYHDDCEICHGGPGVTQSELARGLLPSPPDLGEAAQEWTAAQLFWIVKHGVKMTGMPAWGPTHTDQELWATHQPTKASWAAELSLAHLFVPAGVHNFRDRASGARGLDLSGKLLRSSTLALSYSPLPL